MTWSKVIYERYCLGKYLLQMLHGGLFPIKQTQVWTDSFNTFYFQQSCHVLISDARGGDERWPSSQHQCSAASRADHLIVLSWFSLQMIVHCSVGKPRAPAALPTNPGRWLICRKVFNVELEGEYDRSHTIIGDPDTHKHIRLYANGSNMRRRKTRTVECLFTGRRTF